jgi:hypothetical protein
MRARSLVLLVGLAAVVAAPLAAAEPAAEPGVRVIDTIAGNGERGDQGDGGPATKAELRWPGAVAVDPAGNVYLQQQGLNGSSEDTVRKVDTKGVITTLAGAGEKPPTKDGIPVAESDIYGAWALATDKTGNLYILSSDPKDQKGRLYQVYDGGQKIRTFAGGGSAAPVDGTQAGDALLEHVYDAKVDAAGDIHLVSNYRILKIDHATKLITVVAGTGDWKQYDPSDEGKTATEVGMGDVGNVTADKAGNVYLTDFRSGRLREVSKADGKIRTVACGGSDPVGDGVPALKANCRAGNLAVDAAGTVYFTVVNPDTGYDEGWVLTIDTDKKIRPVVGTGKIGFGGDGGKAADAQLNDPRGLTFDAAGTLYIADSQNQRIRRATPQTPPVAKDDSLSIDAGTDGAGDVLANDKGTKLTVTKHTDATSGTVTIGADGKFGYRPNTGFAGDDSFTYTVTDSVGQQASAKVAVVVKAPGSAPTTTVPPAPQASNGGLASTGASVIGLTAVAVVLLGLGGGLLVLTARRRRRSA